MLCVRDIFHNYKTSAGSLTILQGCSFDLMRNGESLAIIGPSGSGKSTLLAIVASLLRPTSGSVTLDGIDVTSLAGNSLAAFRRDKIGMVFQDHLLLPQCTALENVLLPMLASGRVSAADMQRGENCLERVGLAARKSHRPDALSGGERQRVAIARALMRSPRLLVADEPTGNLDTAHRQEIADLLFEQSCDALLLLVTHDTTLAARATQQKTLVNGKLE